MCVYTYCGWCLRYLPLMVHHLFLFFISTSWKSCIIKAQAPCNDQHHGSTFFIRIFWSGTSNKPHNDIDRDLSPCITSFARLRC